MNNLINEIFKKIEVLNPLHSKKLRKNIAYFDDGYYVEANAFLNKYAGFLASQIKNYLEIGAGHGLYLSKALEILDKETNFSVVDISHTSIELAKNFIDDSRVTYNLANIFDFKIDSLFDFITMGEVLEHVEDPL